MTTRREMLMFRVDSGVAMFAREALWLTSPYHAHASVGLPHDAAKVWPKEFASATEGGHNHVGPQARTGLGKTGRYE